MLDKIVGSTISKRRAEAFMADPDNQENKADQEFLEKMGIATQELVYPQPLPSEENLRLEMQWRMIIARG